MIRYFLEGNIISMERISHDQSQSGQFMFHNFLILLRIVSPICFSNFSAPVKTIFISGWNSPKQIFHVITCETLWFAPEVGMAQGSPRHTENPVPKLK